MELANLKNLKLVNLIFLLIMNPVYTNAKIKCWTNTQGIKECGNRIPAKYAQGASEEFSDSGVLLKRNPKAKEIEQINLDQKKANLRANREKADQLLLNMFSNVAEIELAREKKIEQINQEIKLIESRVQKLLENQTKIQSVLKKSDLKNQVRIKGLESDLITTENQIQQSNQFISEKVRERTLISDKYNRDSERFIELQTSR